MDHGNFLIFASYRILRTQLGSQKLTQSLQELIQLLLSHYKRTRCITCGQTAVSFHCSFMWSNMSRSLRGLLIHYDIQLLNNLHHIRKQDLPTIITTNIICCISCLMFAQFIALGVLDCYKYYVLSRQIYSKPFYSNFLFDQSP